MSEALHTELAGRIGHSLPGRVSCHAAVRPQATALVEKHLGIWREYSWSDYARNVRDVAMSLRARGLKAGDCISILSDNRPEWLFAELGAQAAGILSAGIYQTNPPADVAYVIAHSGSRVVICEDQEQVDKVLEHLDELPALEEIVVIEVRGTREYTEPRLIDWDSFVARGRAAACSDEDYVRELQALDDRKACMIIYTSGTTGPPKGALLSHHNVIPGSDTAAAVLGNNSSDTLLSYLPLCHVAEKIFSIFTPLATGAVVHFGESLDTVQDDLVRVSPSAFLGVPRIWEKMHAGITVRMQDASWLKRRLYSWALVVGQGIAVREIKGTDTGADRLWRRVVDLLVFSALRERIGMGRCRIAASGAAPIAPELLAWFAAIGLPVLEGYGLTETSGLSTITRPGGIRLGTVGQLLPDVELQIADDGEILIRGGNVFLGYLNNEEATRETIDAEGWLHTGDLGNVDDEGHLRISGRKKEIFITAGGKNISPNHIENTIKTSPYIKEVASIGDRRSHVCALIQIEPDVTGNWAMRNGVNFTSFADLAANEAVVKLISSEIERLNPGLPRVEQVRNFRLLPKELHQDDGEVTATQKLRRKVVYEKFAALIDEMYPPS